MKKFDIKNMIIIDAQNIEAMKKIYKIWDNYAYFFIHTP